MGGLGRLLACLAPIMGVLLFVKVIFWGSSSAANLISRISQRLTANCKNLFLLGV
jgi:hypothetical protein